MPLVVRPYRQSDAAALEAMYDEIAAETRTMGLPPATPADRLQWLDALRAGGWNLVALDGERVVGHVAVAPLAAAEPDLVVFVREAYRGRGVGTELLEQLVAYAAAGEYDAVSLDVAADNERALAVYERLGFEVADRTVAGLSMRLPLTESVAAAVSGPPVARE